MELHSCHRSQQLLGLNGVTDNLLLTGRPQMVRLPYLHHELYLPAGGQSHGSCGCSDCCTGTGASVLLLALQSLHFAHQRGHLCQRVAGVSHGMSVWISNIGILSAFSSSPPHHEPHQSLQHIPIIAAYIVRIDGLPAITLSAAPTRQGEGRLGTYYAQCKQERPAALRLTVSGMEHCQTCCCWRRSSTFSLGMGLPYFEAAFLDPTGRLNLGTSIETCSSSFCRQSMRRGEMLRLHEISYQAFSLLRSHHAKRVLGEWQDL